ncbi:hypothetical protein MRY87_08220 [bacterium]|nr:hypothetical protein [bacterium]
MTTSFDRIISSDPTWHYAYHYTRKHFRVPSHLNRVLKAGWIGEATPLDYVKALGFSHLNAKCLIQAAELSGTEIQRGRGSVERAISMLGIRLSAVVLGIHLYTYLFLKSKPPLGWRSFLQEMMTDIECGYHLGKHASLIGVEGGVLSGFALHSGIGLVMATDGNRFKEYLAVRRAQEKVTAEDERRIFGCELYQLSTLIIQQLGFGADVAMGVALASGRIENCDINLPEHAHHWDAAYQWIQALRAARSYPPKPSHRKQFSEIAPPDQGAPRNKRLETLYTEVAPLKTTPSAWLWHLPKGSYDETQEARKLP